MAQAKTPFSKIQNSLQDIPVQFLINYLYNKFAFSDQDKFKKQLGTEAKNQEIANDIKMMKKKHADLSSKHAEDIKEAKKQDIANEMKMMSKKNVEFASKHKNDLKLVGALPQTAKDAKISAHLKDMKKIEKQDKEEHKQALVGQRALQQEIDQIQKQER